MNADSSSHSSVLIGNSASFSGATRKRACSLSRKILSAGALFCAGWVFAAVVPVATSINLGLVQAFDSVGKNLFGSAAFGVAAVPGNPIFPAGNVQIDLASDSRVGTAIGLFIPGNPVIPADPCRRIAQLELRPASVATEGPTLLLAYEPQFGVPTMVARSLVGSAPNVARCNASATTF